MRFGEHRMITDLEEIISLHREKYPLVEPVDLVKLTYQNEFGAEHLAADKDAVLKYLLEEIRGISRTASYIEPIGNGLCRFHFGADTNAELLAELFCKTAQMHKGNAASFEKKLQILEDQDVPEMREFLVKYRAEGARAVHHSEKFRAAYDPHYRLLKVEFAEVFSEK